MPSELPEYQFTRHGIAIPWESKLRRSPSEFFPGERIILKAKLLRSGFQSLYLEPIHEDLRYVDRFYLQNETLESGVYDVLIKILFIKYRSILIGYGNDYLAELLFLEKDLEASENLGDYQDMHIDHNQNFDVYLINLFLNSPTSLLQYRKLVLQRFFEGLSEDMPNIRILNTFLQGLPILSSDELHKLRFIVMLACKAQFFLTLKAMDDNDSIIHIDLNLVISTYNLLIQQEGHNLAIDYLKGIIEIFEF